MHIWYLSDCSHGGGGGGGGGIVLMDREACPASYQSEIGGEVTPDMSTE